MPLRLNLGSGNEPLDGYVNLDLRTVPGVNVRVDARHLPFAGHAANEIRASSLLEHFHDPYSVLDEVHRVLRADGTFEMRVPTPWSMAGVLDSTHVFLADLKLWREILNGYFESVTVQSEGIRYRDHKPLAALLHVAVQVLRMHEFAQVWRFTCRGRRTTRSIAYVPWWLEEKYGVRSTAPANAPRGAR